MLSSVNLRVIGQVTTICMKGEGKEREKGGCGEGEFVLIDDVGVPPSSSV